MAPGSALRPVDKLEVCVVVDNVLDLLSTVPQSVTPELPNLIAAGATELSGACSCCAAWGLSLLIRTYVADERRTVLFDAGPRRRPATARPATRRAGVPRREPDAAPRPALTRVPHRLGQRDLRVAEEILARRGRGSRAGCD